MTLRRFLWVATLGLVSAAAGAAVYMDIDSPVRSVLVLGFLLLFPGLAWVRLLRLDDRLAELTLAVALSIAIDAAVPGALIYTGGWSVTNAFSTVLGLTALATILDTVRWKGSRLEEQRE